MYECNDTYAVRLNEVEELVGIALTRHTGQHNTDVVHRIAVRALEHPLALAIKHAVAHVLHWVPANVLRWHDCRFGPFIADKILPHGMISMYGTKYKLSHPRQCRSGYLPFRFSRLDCSHARMIHYMCSKCKLAVCAHCYSGEVYALELHDDICSLPCKSPTCGESVIDQM